MAIVNFYLRNPKAKEKTPIIMTLSADGKQRKFSTAEKVHPRDWDSKKQRSRKVEKEEKAENFL